MKRWTFMLALTIASLWAIGAEGSEPVSDVRVLYVGKAKGPRAPQFEAFLKRHFAQVTVADREGFDPALARGADIVLLDWSQADSDLVKTAVPFGRLEDWSKPTVLLNSAGLRMRAERAVTGKKAKSSSRSGRLVASRVIGATMPRVVSPLGAAKALS